MADITIYVGDEKESDSLDQEIMKNPSKFEDNTIFFVSPELFPKIFSRERIRLIRALEKKPETINELAKMLGRPREAVSRDLNYLVSLNLIQLKKRGKERVPLRVAPISISI